jgi:hypothetical protein
MRGDVLLLFPFAPIHSLPFDTVPKPSLPLAAIPYLTLLTRTAFYLVSHPVTALFHKTWTI